ncbi:phage head closure protein [Priestia aryabhattai]|uniref:phage head closure protein n=1 Tax=Priestia aryabhattai TaxID=412384 RepID=UPI0023B144E4|nr:phage head closure protein [Priestia aryabhattai]MDE8676456.1 phage head closure protein [Priestia aryabhattai]
MNRGKYKRRITFLKGPEEGQKTERGYPVKDWKPFKKAWAMNDPLSALTSREFYASASVQNENKAVWTTMYTKGIDEDMRIQYKNRIFEIISITNENEANKKLIIVTKEMK